MIAFGWQFPSQAEITRSRPPLLPCSTASPIGKSNCVDCQIKSPNEL